MVRNSLHFKQTDNSPVFPTAANSLGSVSRYLIALLMLVAVALSLYIGVITFNVSAAQQQVDDLFFADRPASSQMLSNLQNDIEALSALLPDYATPKLLLAKLYLIRAKAGVDADSARPDFLSAARQQLLEVRQRQPSHYPAIGLTVWLESQQGLPLSDRLPALRMALYNGDLEKNNQWLLGPVVVADWYQLPEDIRKLSGPMIRSMLSEKQSRQRLLNAMYDAQLFLPFTKFSPNRNTSYMLRTLHAIYISPKSR